MPGSLVTPEYLDVNSDTIAGAAHVGSHSATTQADGTVLVAADLSLISDNVFAAPEWLPGETPEQWAIRNGDAILAAMADLAAGLIDAVVMADRARDLAACKLIQGWVQDAPV